LNNSFKKFRSAKFSPVLIIVLMVIISFAVTAQASGDSVKKVAVCPLEINAAQDLSFLQRGLFTMLYSRLTDPGKVEVLDRETIDKALAGVGNISSLKGSLNKTKAKAIGEAIGVDYILFGSMTQFGNSISLDLSAVDVKGEKPVLVFSKQTSEPGAVITEMDRIATQINLQIFKRKQEVLIPGEQVAQIPNRIPSQISDPQIRYTGALPPAQFSSQLSNYRHIFTAKGIINGIACGDTNGDNKQEVVLIYEHHIEILKINRNGQLSLQAKIDDADYMNIIGLDLADINGNGFAEIFITRIAPRTGKLESFVLEFNSGSYRKIAENLPWHFRLIRDINGNKQLFAQRNGKSGPYSGEDAFRVYWNNNAYVQGEKISVPDGFNIMSFAVDKFSKAGKRNAVFTNMYGKLKLFNKTGTVEWSGDEKYGGSQLFYTFVEKDESMSPKFSETKGVYFHPRNLFLNTKQQDEQTQVLVIKNKDTTDSFLNHFRRFTSGYIEMLRLTEMGLASDMPAKKMPGQITDIMIRNTDNGSNKELWITMVKKRNSFSSKKSTSLVVSYDL
jgi:TolB-like protein